MTSILHVRGDRVQVERVMRELGFDEFTAQRHVNQLRVLRERLHGKDYRDRKYDANYKSSAFGSL